MAQNPKPSVDTALSAVVLAAGESRRMGKPKQLLPFGDGTILERVVDTLLAAGVGEVIVVLGHLADRIRLVLGDRPVKIVINEDYREGMLSSVQCGVRAIGMDYLSIEQFGSATFPVHHVLLGAGVFVIEGLDLRQAEPGRYVLVCLPLKFPGLDGAPARAVLLG